MVSVAMGLIERRLPICWIYYVCILNGGFLLKFGGDSMVPIAIMLEVLNNEGLSTLSVVTKTVGNLLAREGNLNCIFNGIAIWSKLVCFLRSFSSYIEFLMF